MPATTTSVIELLSPNGASERTAVSFKDGAPHVKPLTAWRKPNMLAARTTERSLGDVVHRWGMRHMAAVLAVLTLVASACSGNKSVSATKKSTGGQQPSASATTAPPDTTPGAP